jgi:integral membrane sensor domain MASE1
MVFSGTPKYSVKFGPYFSIGWFPYGGYVATPFIYNDEVDFFITICGPLANLIIAIGLFFTAGMYQFFFAFNAFVAVYALMPLGKKKDGYRLLLILKKWYNFRKHCR